MSEKPENSIKVQGTEYSINCEENLANQKISQSYTNFIKYLKKQKQDVQQALSYSTVMLRKQKEKAAGLENTNTRNHQSYREQKQAQLEQLRRQYQERIQQIKNKSTQMEVNQLKEQIQTLEKQRQYNLSKSLQQVSDYQSKLINKDKQIKKIQYATEAKSAQITQLSSSLQNTKKILQISKTAVFNIQDKIIQMGIQVKLNQMRVDQRSLENVKQTINSDNYSAQIQSLKKLLKIYQFIHYELRQSKKKDQAIIQKDKEIKRLNGEVNKLQSQNATLLVQKKTLGQLNGKNNADVKYLQSILTFRIISLDDYLQNFQKSKFEQQNQLKTSYNHLLTVFKIVKKDMNFYKSIAEKLDILTKQNQQNIAKISKLQNQAIKRKEEIIKLQVTVLQRQQEYKKLKLKNQNQLKTLKDLNQTQNIKHEENVKKVIQNYSQKINKRQNQLLALSDELSVKSKLISSLQKQKERLNSKLADLQKQIQFIKNHSQKNKGDLNSQISLRQMQNKKTQAQLKEQIYKTSKLESQLQNMLQKNKNNEKQNEGLKRKLSEAQSKLENVSSSVAELNFMMTNKKQYQITSENIHTILKEVQSNLYGLLNYSPFLSESAIFNYKNDKPRVNFIRKSIQKFKDSKVSGCQLVYRKDQHKSNVNFHAYIDQTQNLLLVIHLANGRIIGGFTSKPFIKKNTEKPGEGFIFVADTQTVYQMKPDGKQAITYDEFYVIWGNSQIRLRFGEDQVFSNFGILNSYYDNKRDRVNQFLGYQNEREIRMNTFEFYKIKF